MSKSNLKEKDRVVITTNYSVLGSSVKKGTIGTLRTFLNEELVLIQIGYSLENDSPICCGCPISVLKRATINDINNVTDYRMILPKMYHLEKKILINVKNQKNVGIIKGVVLSTNEQNDSFSLLLDNNEKVIFNKEHLDTFGSSVDYKDIPPFDEEENNAYEEENNNTYEEIEDINTMKEDDLNEDSLLGLPSITIDKFIFQLDDDIIVLPKIKKEDLGLFINALQTLKQFGKKE